MDNNNVLATVGGREITVNDLDTLMKSLNPQTARQFQTPDGRRRLLEELINQELFYLDAVKSDIEQDEDFKRELDKAIAVFIKQYAISRYLAKADVGEEEIAAFYEENKNQFKTTESIKASHILVESKKKADEIVTEIASGLAFEEAAQKYSSCPSKDHGGDLGFFTRGKMVPEFEEAAFDMKEGEVSSPVETQFGWHIIKLMDRKPETVKSLDEVKDMIRQELISMKQRDMYFDKINTLKTQYEVKINA